MLFHALQDWNDCVSNRWAKYCGNNYVEIPCHNLAVDQNRGNQAPYAQSHTNGSSTLPSAAVSTIRIQKRLPRYSFLLQPPEQ